MRPGQAVCASTGWEGNNGIRPPIKRRSATLRLHSNTSACGSMGKLFVLTCNIAFPKPLKNLRPMPNSLPGRQQRRRPRPRPSARVRRPRLHPWPARVAHPVPRSRRRLPYPGPPCHCRRPHPGCPSHPSLPHRRHPCHRGGGRHPRPPQRQSSWAAVLGGYGRLIWTAPQRARAGEWRRCLNWTWGPRGGCCRWAAPAPRRGPRWGPPQSHLPVHPMFALSAVMAQSLELGKRQPAADKQQTLLHAETVSSSVSILR